MSAPPTDKEIAIAKEAAKKLHHPFSHENALSNRDIILSALVQAREQDKKDMCTICDGKGWYAQEVGIYGDQEQVQCESCLGTGKVDPSPHPEPVQVTEPYDYAPWVPPFYYDSRGSMIVDSKDQLIVDVRGWGFLTGRGHAALALGEEKAEDIQNRLGEHITKFLNQSSLFRGNEEQKPERL